MAEPKITLILDEIENRLKNISKSRGYFSGVDGVIKRGKLTPWDGSEFPAINLWATGFDSQRGNYQKDERSLFVYVEIHDYTHEDDNFIDIANRLAADVVTAINRSTSAPLVSDPASFDLGGMVEDILLNGVDYEIGEGQKPFCGALCRFTVKFEADIMDLFGATIL